MVMAEAILNGTAFKVPLEPDGLGGHWFKISETFRENKGLKIGSTVTLSIQSTDEWTEPEVPEDLNRALGALQVENQWDSLTTKARWEWIRWIRSTKNPQTRQ